MTQPRVRTREATYPGSRAEVFRLAQVAVAPTYAIAHADAETGTILTTVRRHEPDGSYQGTSDHDREAGMAVRTEAGSIDLGFRISVIGDVPPFRVAVEPVAQEYRSNYVAPYTFVAGDPALPGWIVGKVDNLQLAVHRRLARWLPPSPVVAQK